MAYLVDRALALVVADGNGLRFGGDLRRMLARPTLSAMLDVLRSIEQTYPGEALASQTRVSEAVGRVAAYRNMLTHLGPRPNTEDTTAILPSILQVLEAVVAHMGDREEELVLVQESKTRIDGSMASRAYRLTGASISGWDPLVLVHPSPVPEGPALHRQERLVPMWPFAIAAPDTPGVLLFSGLRRKQVDWLSPTGRQRDPEADAGADVRQCIEGLLGPDDNPSPSIALSGVGRILSGARGLK